MESQNLNVETLNCRQAQPYLADQTELVKGVDHSLESIHVLVQLSTLEDVEGDWDLVGGKV